MMAARAARPSHFSVLRDISPPSVEPSQRMSGSFRFDHNFTDHVLMIVSVEGDRAGVPEGASPAGCKIERVTLTGASKRGRGKAEIGNGELCRLTTLVQIEQRDLHCVALLDPQGGIGLTVDRPASPEEAMVAVSGGEVCLAIGPDFRAAHEGERLDLRPGSQCQVRRCQRNARNESQKSCFAVFMRHHCSPVAMIEET